MARRLTRPPPLKDTHRRFVDAFLGEANGNATKAAVLAGVPKTGAHVTAWRWLRTATIQAAIAKRTKRKTEQGIATADERDRIFSGWVRDEKLAVADRARAGMELNRCEGRHSVTHHIKGRVSLEVAIAESRQKDDDEAKP